MLTRVNVSKQAFLIEVVSQRLGHGLIGITVGRYVHVYKDRRADAFGRPVAIRKVAGGTKPHWRSATEGKARNGVLPPQPSTPLQQMKAVSVSYSLSAPYRRRADRRRCQHRWRTEHPQPAQHRPRRELDTADNPDELQGTNR